MKWLEQLCSQLLDKCLPYVLVYYNTNVLKPFALLLERAELVELAFCFQAPFYQVREDCLRVQPVTFFGAVQIERMSMLDHFTG